MQRFLITGALCIFLSGGSLSAYPEVQILEEGGSVPYESLGFVQVEIPSTQLLGGNAGRYKKLLNRELRRKAASFGAEALVHAEYWPDLSTKEFPSEFMYAKAEMVRFKRFPVPSSDEPAADTPAGS